jgi:hypothetical protein
METQIVGISDNWVTKYFDDAESAMASDSAYVMVFKTVVSDSGALVSLGVDVLRPNSDNQVIQSGWKIVRSEMSDYYGRTKLGLLLEDPEGKSVQIRSGGFSDWNLMQFKVGIMIKLIRWFEMLSCFSSNSSRVEYFKKFKSNDESIEPYIGLNNL